MIFEYGEERYSRRIARAIVAARELTPIRDDRRRWRTSSGGAIPRRGYQRIDPATRTFQALRIWVNRELEGLDRFLAGRGRSGCSAARGWR